MSTIIKACILTLATTLISTTLFAATADRNAIRNKQIFGIEFPGERRAFYAAESSVRSISLQEYITTGFRVVEINVVTNGNALLRIYYARTLRAGEATEALGNATAKLGVPSTSFRPGLPANVQALADKASQKTEEITGDTVIKEYPLATHARTIEYRLTSLDELLDLFDKLQKHWLKEPIEDESGNTEPRALGGTRFKVN